MNDQRRFVLGKLKHLLGDAYPVSALPPEQNIDSVAGFVEALHAAWSQYGTPAAVVAMIVQSQERNAIDQRLLEYALDKNHKVIPLHGRYHFSFLQVLYCDLI